MYESYLGYFYEGFPEAMRDIARGSSGSVVRCNFDAGEPWDAEKVVRANKMWTSAQWNEGWLRHEQLFWETEAPLPEWPALLMENMIDSFSGFLMTSQPENLTPQRPMIPGLGGAAVVGLTFRKFDNSADHPVPRGALNH
ncbi:hypothetical protein CLIM01_07893 [Colletotrichum limetticola]|uniref:Uncharacterized protein n=1 Tax=Colletotrichum limetticola TaxID=1209924 RepID=A0ABQ9PTB0_9PEZI|nr:hypothetical protein CLIM01_07893 [Colletotrichum limetticola]